MDHGGALKESAYLPRLFLALWVSFFWDEQPFPLEDGESGPCEEVLSKFHVGVLWSRLSYDSLCRKGERAFSFYTLPHGAGEAGGARGGRSREMLGKASLQKPPTLKFKVFHMPRYPTRDLWAGSGCLNPHKGWRRTKVRAIYSTGIQTF